MSLHLNRNRISIVYFYVSVTFGQFLYPINLAFRPTDIELIREVLQGSNERAFETRMKRDTSSVYGATIRLLK